MTTRAEPAPTPPRTRRALLAGALGGLAAWAAAAAARADPTAAAAGDPIRMGQFNKAGGTSTTLQTGRQRSRTARYPAAWQQCGTRRSGEWARRSGACWQWRHWRLGPQSGSLRSEGNVRYWVGSIRVKRIELRRMVRWQGRDKQVARHPAIAYSRRRNRGSAPLRPNECCRQAGVLCPFFRPPAKRPHRPCNAAISIQNLCQGANLTVA